MCVSIWIPAFAGNADLGSASRRYLSVRPVRSPPGMLQLPTRWRAGDAGWPRVVWAAVARQLPVEARNAIIPRPRGRCASAGSRRCFTSWSLEPTAAGPGCSGRSPVLSLRWLREAAFRRATPLDHTTPAPLNIATARLAGVVRAVCIRVHRWGMEVAAFPTADCWNGFVKWGFQGALSSISRGGFRGIQSAPPACHPEAKRRAGTYSSASTR